MKLLLIKLGALGDVLRTTPLLPALKKKYPALRLTWLVDAKNREALEGNPFIEELWDFSPVVFDRLSGTPFDVAVNLDKDEEALEAVMAARAPEKKGFGRSREGRLCPLDALSEYAYRLGIDDDLKFRRNRKSYQEISFEQLGIEFQGEEYVLPLAAEELRGAREHLTALGVDLRRRARPIVGLNTGSGRRFAGKRLPSETFIALAERFHHVGASVFLLGGRDEVERNREIQRRCPFPVVNTGSHRIKRFAGIVKACDLVVSGDTTAMHVAIAVKVPVVAYFASTCSAEIELYGRGRKLVSPIDCAPCYKRICPIDEKCMTDMTADLLFEAARDMISPDKTLQSRPVS